MIRPAPHLSLAECFEQTQIECDDPRGFPADIHPVQRVGLGSFSEVWQVRDARTGHDYALKRLTAQWLDEPAARGLLDNEARVGTTVRSSHVVGVIQSDSQCDLPYNLLEWLDGKSLEMRLADDGALPVGLATWIARQTLQGIWDLAKAGYAHGDIKPANIYLTGNGRLKLIDLGFAQSLHRPMSATATADILTGTADYMAPEVISGDDVDPVIKDVYSLGVLMYRMLAGRLPFEADQTEQVLRLHREATATPLQKQNRSIPKAISELVGRMLSKNPEHRPHNLKTLMWRLTELELTHMSNRFAA